MPVEPVSLTLAALALLDPAIKSCRKAYESYKLSKAFGNDYASVQRKIDGEKARLEASLNLELSTAPDTDSIETIKRELGSMQEKFRACQAMILSIDSHAFKHTAPDPHKDSDDARSTPAPKKHRLRSFFSRKKSRPKGISDSSGSTDPSDITPVTSESTLASHSTYADPLGATEVDAETKRQEAKSKEYQQSARLYAKGKWTTHQRKRFLENIDGIHDSNDLIRDIATVRALVGIHHAILGSKKSVEVPDYVSAVNESLRRVHRGLASFNHNVVNQPALSVKLRVSRMEEYISNPKRIALEHTYLHFREESIVYPIQIDAGTASKSKLVLVEALLHPPGISDAVAAPQGGGKALSQAICDDAPEDDEPFRQIGEVISPDLSTDTHALFQDVSVSWNVQQDLQSLIRDTTRFRTYLNLAARLAISYMYFISVGGLRSFPKLSDYQYYTPIDEEHKEFDSDNILSPYLSAGFGRKTPKRSTNAIGGIAGPSMQQNEALTRLGLILYQVGCWTALEGANLLELRTAVRRGRNDLLDRTGVPFTEIVDQCLDSKEDYCEPQEEVRRLYTNVIAPLQELADQVRWDV